MNYAPIVLFVYKRPAETRLVLETLAANEGAEQSELFVYADGPKNEADAVKCEAVRELVRNFSGFAKITLICSENNRGLANSVIRGVSETLAKYDRVIVLEDDLVTSKYFLRFMNEALEKYEHDDRICCIHGFSPPTKYPEIQYFLRRGADCWGWGTWKRGWTLFSPDAQKMHDQIVERKLNKLFDRNGAFPYTKMLQDQADGKIDSWAIRWYASAFLAEKYTLQSNCMLVENIGFGNDATHCSSKHLNRICLTKAPIRFDREAEMENDELKKEYFDWSKTNQISFIRRCMIKLEKFFGY